MKKIIPNLYELFEGMYGSNLAKYLSGYCKNGESNEYGDIGLFLLLIPVIMSALFYFFLADRNFYRPRQWWIFASFGCLVMLIIGASMSYNDLSNGLVCESVKYAFTDCVMFGFVNVIWAFLFFLMLSQVLQRVGKKSARYTPFSLL